MQGWNRGDLFPDTGLPWVFPSPNMPSWETAVLYPGMVLLEGCNVSEGRGSTLPFQLFGAPFSDQKRLGDAFRCEFGLGVAAKPALDVPNGFGMTDKKDGCWHATIVKDTVHSTGKWPFLPTFYSAVATPAHSRAF